ncbi:MAG: DUF1186 domain-containing protein [Verrucomicrobiia bacterium]
MSNTENPAEQPNQPDPAAQAPTPAAQDAPATGSVQLPGFLPPDRILAQLSAVRDTQPVAAIATANQHREALTGPFLKAVEDGLTEPSQDFSTHGMLFNYATYFLAKWREPAAFPLFLRWFSLPGEDALELGGDTVSQHGGRFLASVCGGDVESIKALALNRTANPVCRAQAMRAVAVLSVWGELPRDQVESWFQFLAREGLEREKGVVWHELARLSIQLELLALFPGLRQALEQGFIDQSFLKLEDLETVDKAPRGTLLNPFTELNGPITNVVQETRWWAGFQRRATEAEAAKENAGVVSAGEQYVAPRKVGRNDPCPCGSGKKFKKCHGQ